MSSDDTPYLARWSRRKAALRAGRPDPDPVEQPPAPSAASVPAERLAPPPVATPVDRAQPAPPATAIPAGDSPAAAEPAPPTLSDVASLTRESDFARFVAPGVDGDVRNAALKKLFEDPHYNVMDGLDTYIDDYNRPDPLPAHVARQMLRSSFLGLVDSQVDEAKTPSAATLSAGVALPTPPDTPSPDGNEDPDLQLQPHDAAGCASPEPGAAADGSGEP